MRVETQSPQATPLGLCYGKGKKGAVRRWSSHDPGFLHLFIQCLKETDTSRKGRTAQAACAPTSKPFGPIWGGDQTAMYARTDGDSAPDVARR